MGNSVVHFEVIGRDTLERSRAAGPTLKERSHTMPKDFELSDPAFVGLFVSDVDAAADFYEKKLGFRRDPEVFPRAAVAFQSYPIPFAVMQVPPGVDLGSLPRPRLVPAIWFKTANSQVVHDALIEADVTILRPPSDGRFGRQFTFVDLDGYAITVYDRDAPPNGWDQTD
jgi:catechol 2,3-dioxygenase-like lactoylglutathione lyase family enzyme